MKKKLIIAAAVFCTLIVGLLIVARITGMLQFFSVPSPSNQPNIKPGDKIYSSNLKNPEPYNFIVFTSEYADSINMATIPGFKAESHYIHRLCAVPGDIIEMKYGVLFVNNKNFDQKLNLYNEYRISAQAFYSISDDDINGVSESARMQMISQDSAVVTFDSILLKKYARVIRFIAFIESDNVNGVFKWNDKYERWGVDNFGPLQIPADCYFVLGDNRHNALDSRYIGFVKKENIKGVVLNK